ncbi:MAG: hypothetical protein PHO01_08335 [Desulfotomaculaceae bacterium]|nr:hypothetical protein [Desulfotomaculaceae bacterium]
MEVDWGRALLVALTGIVSVFLGLGILDIAVTISGYIFGQSEKRKKEKANS